MRDASVREDLLAFLDTIRRPQYPKNALQDHERLVESGLIDSLAVLNIILYLETNFGIDFSEAGVDPDQLGSIGGILDLIERRSKR